MDICTINHDQICTDKLMAAVSSPLAGSTVVFVGTTRTPYQDKEVLYLEYEAYIPMALKKMQEIITESKTKFSLLNVCIQHRLGRVDICAASIVVVVSSVHRIDGIKATEWIMDEVKSKVPIWKKEVYADEGSAWKENPEALGRKTVEI
jgi:molybdopterin synthase catalytic subunit